MKKLLAILLSMLLLCAAVPLGAVSVAAEVLSGTTGDCTWTLVDGHLTISGEGAMADYDPLNDNLPWWRATSLTIEEGVTRIGVYAFGHSYLTTVSIADSVSSIGAAAFVECTDLTSVNIPEGVTTIEGSTFYGCTALTSITIPASVTTIIDSAFCESSNIADVYYTGSEEDRANINIGVNSAHILNAKWHYNYGGEPEVLSGITGDCTWTLVDGHLTISGEGEMADYDPIDDTPPWRSATSLTIEEGVTHIGVYAFGHLALTTASIANSVSSIGNSAFVGCGSLTSVNIPDSVTAIEWSTFYGCTALTSITIPDSVTAIDEDAFIGCTSLASIILPSSITAIDESAFEECFSLTDVYYTGSEDDRTNIAIDDNNDPLLNATWHYNYGGEPEGDIGLIYEIVDGAVTITGGTNALPTDLIIPDTIEGYPVTAIDRDAFLLCDFLMSVTIPDSVTTIGFQAFLLCRSLTSVIIGNNVTYIGWQAFSGCSSLTSVTIGDSVTAIDEGAFHGCSSLTSVTISDSVAIIAEGAFQGCSSLTSIILPSSITTIGGYAFAYCDSLTDVYYAGSEDDRADIAIDDDNDLLLNATWHYNYGNEPEATFRYEVVNGTAAIVGCSDTLTGHIVIPDTIDGYIVTELWEGALNNRNITGVTLPTHLREFSPFCCYDAPNLATIEVPEENDYFCVVDGVLYSKDQTILCRIPPAKGISSYIVPDGVTQIEHLAFYPNSLSYLYLPKSVTYFGDANLNDDTVVEYGGSEEDRDAIAIDWWFNGSGIWHYNCPAPEPEGDIGLTYEIADGAVTITGFTDALPAELTILDTIEGYPVTAIGDYAFFQCESLASVTIPDSVTHLGESAFYCCTSLSSVTLGNSIATIGYGAFTNCNRLTAIVIPNSVTLIGERAFFECHSLASVTFGQGLISICDRAFVNCKALLSVEIPDSVTYLGEFAFSDCSSLRNVTLGSGITALYDGAFQGCSSLTSIVIPNSVTYVGNGKDGGVFEGCTSLTDVYYTGSEADRTLIEIETCNDTLLNAMWHYNYGNEPEVAPGDANGDGRINNRDLGLLQQYLADWGVELNVEAMDVNGDGRVNNRDLGLVQQYLADWDVELK